METKKCHVICLNDFPSAVVIGTEGEANVEKDRLAEKYLSENYVNYTSMLYWHVKTVPIVGDEVHAAAPELLDAAQSIMEWYDRDGSVGGIQDPMDSLRAAIGKATASAPKPTKT